MQTPRLSTIDLRPDPVAAGCLARVPTTCSRLCICLIAAAVTAGWIRPTKTAADELVLKGGGIVRGMWLNTDRESPQPYEFKTDAGIRVSFQAKDVHEARVSSKKIREYERIAPTHADNPEAQWKLAEWCRQQGLMMRRETHLKRIIELSPNHVLARRALGYSQVDGEWVTQASFFTERGYEMHHGQWLSPQEIEVEKRNAAAKRLEMSWYVRLKRSRKQLSQGPNPSALETFHSIQDPAAIYGLMKLWRSERSAAARRVYANSLVQIKGTAALAALVNIALYDPDLDVFHVCMKRLRKDATPKVIEAFVKSLRSTNNYQVNRAAAGLAEFRDPTTVDALIEALVTTHSHVVGNGSPDQITSSFGSSPGNSGSAMKTGDQRKVFREAVPNEGVLNALVSITGQSFGFNQRAWSAYWDNRQMNAAVNQRLNGRK